MTAFRPGGPNGHALSSATYAVLFNQPFDAAIYREAIGLKARVKDQFPRQQLGQSVTVQVALNSSEKIVAPTNTQPQTTNVRYDRVAQDGTIARALVFENNHVVVQRMDYESWAINWPEIRQAFSWSVPVAAKARQFTGFGTQVVDRFILAGRPGSVRAGELFKPDSVYMPRHARDCGDLWHSHHGYFEFADDPLPHRRLVNVNVGVNDLPSSPLPGSDLERIIQITNTIQITLNDPLSGESDIFSPWEGGTALIDTYMNRAHDLNKAILKELVTQDVADAIGL